MKLVFLRQALLMVGVALVLTAIVPYGSGRSLAAPNLLITDTSTAEPPSPTSTETPIATATPTATNTPVVTSTPTNTPSATPSTVSTSATDLPTLTSIPTEFPTDEPRRSTDTPLPTNTPLPTSTPGAGTPSATPSPLPGPDLSLTKEVAGSALVQVGDTVEYQITVTNQGSEPVNDVVITDDLPVFLELVSASASQGQVEVNGSSVVVTIGRLEPGAQVTLTIIARVARYALPSESGNVAVARSSDIIDPTANNSDRADVTIQPPGSPTAGPGPVVLPTTGPGSSGGLQLGLLALGLACIAASLLVRRRGAVR